MVAVCLACAVAALGLHRRKHYGLTVAVTILIINLVGDLTNVVLAHDWRPLIGLPVGGMILAYLFYEVHCPKAICVGGSIVHTIIEASGQWKK